MTARDAIVGQSSPSMLNLVQALSTAWTRLHPLRILLVDDQEDKRDLVILFFKNLPYSVGTAANGLEAFEKIQPSSHDIVLMEGLQATTTIRQWEQTQDRLPTPIMALTAHTLAEEREKSLVAGYTAHLTKPIKKQDSQKTIESYTCPIQHQFA